MKNLFYRGRLFKACCLFPFKVGSTLLCCNEGCSSLDKSTAEWSNQRKSPSPMKPSVDNFWIQLSLSPSSLLSVQLKCYKGYWATDFLHLRNPFDGWLLRPAMVTTPVSVAANACKAPTLISHVAAEWGSAVDTFRQLCNGFSHHVSVCV